MEGLFLLLAYIVVLFIIPVPLAVLILVFTVLAVLYWDYCYLKPMHDNFHDDKEKIKVDEAINITEICSQNNVTFAGIAEENIKINS